MKIRHLADVPAVDLQPVPIDATRLVTGDDHERIGVTHMALNGDHPWVSIEGNDIFYYILDGTGWFQQADAGPIVGAPDDLVQVPSGTLYRYGGAMRYLNIQSPPIRPENVR